MRVLLIFFFETVIIMTKKYIFFYSDRCIFSKKVKSALESLPIYNSIHLFQVDEQFNEIPDTITRVPTLVVSASEKYIGETILKWANNISTAPTIEETFKKSTTNCLLSEPLSRNPLSTMDYTFVNADDEKESKTSLFSNCSLIDNPDDAMTEYKNQLKNSGNQKCTEKDYEQYIKERDNLNIPARTMI